MSRSAALQCQAEVLRHIARFTQRKLGLNRSEFQALAQIRIDEAVELMSAGRFDGAYYLAGYAVECALKACIAKLTNLHDFPPQDTKRTHYVHDLAGLVRTAGLEQSLAIDMSSNAPLKLSWKLVAAWNESSRYLRKSQKECEDLINSINDPQNGVLPWLIRHW